MMLAYIRDNFAAAFFPRLSEWAAAAGVFLIGLVLAANPDLMATTKTQAYQLMLMIATQRSWAMMLMVFGGARLVVLLINGAWRRSPPGCNGLLFPLSLLPHLSVIPADLWDFHGLGVDPARNGHDQCAACGWRRQNDRYQNECTEGRKTWTKATLMNT